MMFFRKNNLFVALLATLFMVGCQSSDTDAQSADAAADDPNKVVLTEYSDYQCPACAYYHPIVEKIKNEMGDKVEVQLRFFPLNGHRYSALAARAAQAAKNQDKFYEMHALLFENQQQWSQASNPVTAIVNFARELELDLNQFTEDLNAGETQKIVMEQKQEGADMGVNSTPTFYLDGEEVEPLPKTYEEFKAQIEERLANKQGS
ncbi:DsbA family protein [Fodinibius salsisoli]|uniref:Thioredoxin domain-containing protein n=1 Tax=Fodinibius salsisoli TaxID=2820877 RepID=A0ABT3PLX8_9BACT|nr:thioredoxin domain-containing protein [Fodinibius salsisoli]MCW9706954.1 thioredoxin domain-containing protein [Fodinibius salsisoli]